MDDLEGTVVDDCCIVSEADGSLSYQRFFREKKFSICTLAKKVLLFMDVLLIFMLVLLTISLTLHVVAHSSHDKDEITSPLTLTVASINSTDVLLEDTKAKEVNNLTLSSVLRAKMWRFRVVLEDDDKRNSTLKFLCIVVMSLAIIFLACMPFLMCVYMSSEESGGKDWHLLDVKIEKRPKLLS